MRFCMVCVTMVWACGPRVPFASAQSRPAGNQPGAAGAASRPFDPKKTSDVQSALRRGASGPDTRPARAMTVRELLNTRLREFVVHDESLRDVLDLFADRLHVNVVVRWAKLENEAIPPTKPISLNARDLPAQAVLGLILQEAGGADVRLAFRASSDLILITTYDDFARQIIVRTYDVLDLIAGQASRTQFFFGSTARYVDTVEPVVGNSAALVRPVTRDWWSGVGAEVIGAGRNDDFSAEARERRIRELIDAIKNTIEPDSWDTHGGPGTASFFDGRLIVRNSPLVHQLIAGSAGDD